MASELESDMLGPAAEPVKVYSGGCEAIKAPASVTPIGCDGGCCDDEDAREEEAEEEPGPGLAAEPLEETEESSPSGDAEASPEISEAEAAEASPSTQTKLAPKRARSCSARRGPVATAAASRAKSLGARARLAKTQPVTDTLPEKPEKRKPKTLRPSLLLKIRPMNLAEAQEAFFESGCLEAPKFTYAFSDEVVSKAFEENSSVDFEHVAAAKRILDKVHSSYGGPDLFMQLMYGEEKADSQELKDLVAGYLKEQNVEDKVEIRLVDGMLSAANVATLGEGRYVVNIANGPVSKPILQSICDHEVGTHLLRMMNDEHQVWHGCRDRYKLQNPWITEEGFATLNTYLTLPCKLLFTQALRYWAVCCGAQMGFVELFAEIRKHVSDLRRCWQICCRVKRGLLDTSKPGAFYMDQAYFQGAVEILMHLEEVDFGRLYGGQIALQDMDKVHFILRKEVVRLPLFLNSAEKLHRYLAHCRDLMRENMIEASPEKLCKRIFVRAGLQFFKKEERTVLRTTGSSSPLLSGLASRSSDLAKTEGAPSRPTAARDEPEEGNSGIKSETPTARKSNFVRLAELAMPRCDRPPPAEDAVPGLARSVDLDRILSLARPKIWEERVQAAPAVVRISRTEEAARELALRELAKPKVRPEAPAVAEVVTGPSRPVDSERLAALAAPRRPSEPSDRPSSKEPSKRRRRKRSKLRLLALVQSRTDSESMGCGLRESPEEAADYPPEEEGEESAEGEAEDAKPIVIEVAESPSQETAMAVGSPKVQEKAEVTTAVDVQEDTPEVAAPVFAAEQGEECTCKSRPRRRSASLKAPLCRPVLARQALPIKTLMLDLGV